MLGLALCLGWAEEQTLPPLPPRPPKPTKEEWQEMDKDARKEWRAADRAGRKYKHSVIALPVVAANNYDGLLVGVAGQYSYRPRQLSYGYLFRMTFSGTINLNLDFANIVSQIEYRGKRSWDGMIRYRSQRNYPYSGNGGAAAVQLKDDEGGNAYREFSYFLSTDAQIGNVKGLRWYVGQALTAVGTDPVPGGNLDLQDPFGANGGIYADVTGGILYKVMDRFPRPVEGWYGEFGTRVAIAAESHEGESGPHVAGVVGLFAQFNRWQPLYKDWLVLGIRAVGDYTFGHRPFFDATRLGGIERMTLSLDKVFTGYGLYRYGGDGVMDTLIELRGKIWHFDYPRFDLLLNISAYGEVGYVFERWDPGPPLPVVGGSMDFILFGMIYLRPFLSAGWTIAPGETVRKARPLFGLSARGTL